MEQKQMYHIKVKQLKSGQKTWEADVQTEGFDIDEALSFSDKLTSSLSKRYPIDVTLVTAEK